MICPYKLSRTYTQVYTVCMFTYTITFQPMMLFISCLSVAYMFVCDVVHAITGVMLVLELQPLLV